MIKTLSRVILICLAFLGQYSQQFSHAQDKVENQSEAVEVLDIENFWGEKIQLSEKQPVTFSKVILDLKVPPQYKLLAEAKPNLGLFNANGKLLQSFLIKEGLNTFNVPVNKEMNRIYAHLALYYCREGETGVCLLKNVLFTILLEEDLKYPVLTISYTVKPENG